MAKTLYLYTSTFPFGRGEAYLEAEVGVLSKRYDKVVVLPINSSPKDIIGDRRVVPENFEVVDLFQGKDVFEGSTKNRWRFLFAAKKNLKFLRDLRYQISLSGGLSQKASILSNFLKDKEEGVHYSYWFSDWAIVLAFLTKNKEIKKYYSRAHGFDLYEERERLGYQPWRKFQLKYITKVFTVSRAGADYLKEKYPSFSREIETSYLGTADHGENILLTKGAFHLVSCSAIIPLKRVERIMSAISLLNNDIKWTHIGHGPDFENLKEKAKSLPANIYCSFVGSLSNKDVMRFYKETPIDCFVNVSTTEGLPVAMMEAISFGIPILATDVGGVKEIVTPKTGLLISPDFSDRLLADTLSDFFETHGRKVNVKKEVRGFWKDNFVAVKNYEDFCERVGGEKHKG